MSATTIKQQAEEIAAESEARAAKHREWMERMEKEAQAESVTSPSFHWLSLLAGACICIGVATLTIHLTGALI